MPFAPTVTLDVQSVRLSSRFGTTYNELHSGKWTFSFKVKLPWRDSLSLASGEKADEIELTVSLRESAKEFVDWAAERTKDHREEKDQVCGLVHYSEAYESKVFGDGHPASILFDLWAPKEVIASLVGFAQQGRHITQFRCEVRGMEYGFDPDGREKKWANSKENNTLPVINVEYVLPVLVEAEPDYSDDEAKAQREPQTPVGADLAPLLRELMKFQKWALWLLAAIAGAVVFRSWG